MKAVAIEVRPTLWCRNTWAWRPQAERPLLERRADADDTAVVST